MSRDNMMKFIPVEASKWGEMVQATARVKELEEVLANLKAERDQFKEEVERLNSELFTCSCANANMHKYKEENARLKAEVERLTERNHHLEQIDSYLQSANLNAEEQRSLELEAQVERLTKAGYAMAVKINVHGINDRFTDSKKLVDDWSHAAKGVQS